MKKIITKKEKKIKIIPEMLISDLAEKYPDVVEFLIIEYNFHCVNCVLAGFETLEEGIKVHGITKKEFKEMLKIMNEMVG